MVTNSDGISNRRLHEINVIGTMNLLAAAGASGSSVRHIVVKSSTLVYGSSARDPSTFSRGHPPQRAGRAQYRAGAARGREPGARLLRGQPGHAGDGAPLRQRPRSPPHHRHQPQPVAPALPVHLRIRSPAAVRRGGRRRACPPPRHPGRHSRPLQRGRRGTSALERGGRHLRHPTRPALPLQPVEDPPAGPAVRPPARAGGPVALRPRRRHPSPGRDRLRLPGHQCRGGAELYPRQEAAARGGQGRHVVHLRVRRRAVLPALALGDRPRRSASATRTERLSGSAIPPPARAHAPPTPRT